MMRRFTAGRIATYAYFVVTCAVLLYPLFFMLLGSFVTVDQYHRTKVIPIPNRFSFEEYANVLTGGLEPAILVTAKRVLWYLALTLVVSLLGGYVFSRLDFPGKQAIFMFFLSGLMVPGILISLPTYMLLARWPLVGGNSITGTGGHGFVNEWPALFILGMVDIFGLFLVKQNYDMLPAEYEEAAIMDGAGLFTIVFRIYAPMLKPVLTAVTVITFVAVWNDYFYPLLLVAGNADLTPIALAVQRLIYSFSTREGVAMTPFPTLFAAATLMCTPPILVYLALQRYFVQGLVGIGLKGA
ncbi:MAG: carbohydrate ABC transporter permease [Chloroflexi bacterium]|nr:carbohydrate ABC transporter permease [Chloroflexota bacterium]